MTTGGPLIVRALRVPPAIVLARAAAELSQTQPVDFACWDSSAALADDLAAERVDLCMAPTNLAARLYRDHRTYRVANVAMWGILHVLGRAPARGWTALGRARLAIPLRGNMPDTIFQVLVARQPDAPKPDIQYCASYLAAAEALARGEVDAAVLPEPIATAAVERGAVRWLDLQVEWGRILKSAPRYPQAVTLVHRRRAVEPLHVAVADAVAWMTGDPDAAGRLGEPLLGVAASTIAAAVRTTYWAAVPAMVARPEIEVFLRVLEGASQSLFNGPLPEADFYA